MPVLKRHDLWDRTLLIVTSDHGEEFGEHGGAIHSRTCYGEVTRVPLIVRIPGESPQRIQARVALLDIAPTLLELLGGDPPDVRLDGQSLYISAQEPGLLDADRPIPCAIFDVMSGRSAFFTRSVRVDRWSFCEEAITAKAELYDLLRDPEERSNLVSDSDQKAVVAELRCIINGNQEGNLFRVSRGLE